MADEVYEGVAHMEQDNPNPGDTTAWLADFPTSHFHLGEKHKEKLQEVKRRIMDPISPPYVKIVGTASRKGGLAYNQALSENRARSVRNFLLEQGVSARRLPSPAGLGERKSHEPGEQDNWWTERAVTIVISLRPLPDLRLPRPRLPPDRPEHVEPRVFIPHSRRFSIQMDFAGSISSALRRARIGRLLARVLPILRRFAGAARLVGFDVVVFTIRDKDHTGGWFATYVYVAGGRSLGLSVDVTGQGPPNDFSTSRLINLMQFGGLAQFGGGGVDVGSAGAGYILLLMWGPFANAGAVPVLISPFRAGPSLGASISMTQGPMLLLEVQPIGIGPLAPGERPPAASTH